MTTTKHDAGSSKRFSISPVWIIPLLAAVAVGVMLFDSYARLGPSITVTFEKAVGINAEKTPVRYKGVEIGRVSRVGFDTSTGTAVLECRLNSDATEFAKEGAVFWIQYPEIGLDGVESLDTLISGPYIAAFPGDGAARGAFTGLEERPFAEEDAPGLRLRLESDGIGSARRASPIIYKGIEVGFIDRVSAPENATEKVVVDALVHERYAHLVRTDSFFWEASGISIDADLIDGVNVAAHSLRSILNGGIRFDSHGDADATAVESGHAFHLHPDRQHIQKRTVRIRIDFADGVGLVENSTKIVHKGVAVGVVTDVTLHPDLGGVVVSADLDGEYAALAVDETMFWIVRPELGLGRVKNATTLITGVYIDSRLGGGPARTKFTGFTEKPDFFEQGDGLDLVLRAKTLGSITDGAPIFYKQVVVGRVTGHTLNATSSGVLIYVRIDPEYAPLVRHDSKFWNVSGVSVEAGLANFKVKFETIESILAGGLAFATPSQGENSEVLDDGATFDVEDEERSSWRSWDPGISLMESP